MSRSACDLAIPSDWIDDDSTRPSPYIDRVGGAPVCLRNHFVSTPLCSLCNSEMIFLCQIYTPVKFDRVVYVFACGRASCHKRDRSLP